jgi:hypothetical protein
MKVQSTLTLLSKSLLIVMLLITACTKDDGVAIPPSITILEGPEYISGDTILAAGEEIRLKVKLEMGDLNITNFIIDVFTDDNQTYFDTGMNTSSIIWEGSFLKSLASNEEWNLTVRDRDGNASNTSFNISLDTNSNFNSLKNFTSIDLGAQNNAQSAGLFDPTNGVLYFYDQAAEDSSIQKVIDLLYFYNDEDKNTIASPGANIDDGIFTGNPADWTIVNTTRYIKTSLTADDFYGACNDSIILANYDEGEAKRKAKNLEVNNIYTFKTQSGKLGIFILNEVNGAEDGSVNIDLKIQH